VTIADSVQQWCVRLTICSQRRWGVQLCCPSHPSGAVVRVCLALAGVRVVEFVCACELVCVVVGGSVGRSVGRSVGVLQENVDKPGEQRVQSMDRVAVGVEESAGIEAEPHSQC
jgi:hypothetical protein